MQVELEVLEKEHTRLKEKHDAAKTRSQVLSKELKNAKAQVKTLTEKGKHDDELVSALLVNAAHFVSYFNPTVV